MQARTAPRSLQHGAVVVYVAIRRRPRRPLTEGPLLKRIQSLLQRLFLAAEAVANRVFGDRLNPSYYLGAISVWVFWLVVASGLYLDALCDTGIEQPYASMDAISRG